MTPVRAWLHPGLSTLCAAGCGLVLWVAISSMLLLGSTGTLGKLVDLQVWALALGALLAAGGLVVLLPRPVPPDRGWRRTLIALLLTVGAGLALALLQLHGQPDPIWLTLLALLGSGGALLSVVGLTLLETDQVGLQLPARLALALLCGASLLFALIALLWPGPVLAAGPVPSLVLLVTTAAALLVASWHAPGGPEPGAWPHRHWLVLGLLAALPLLAAALLYLHPGWARWLWPLVALSVLAGAFGERAQAR